MLALLILLCIQILFVFKKICIQSKKTCFYVFKIFFDFFDSGVCRNRTFLVPQPVNQRDSNMSTAVIYARVSSTNDRQNTQRQIEDLTRFANSNNYNIIGTYEEHISGATKNENRTVLMECLDFCVSQNANFLLLSELSRLGRSTLQVLKSLEMLHEAGVSVYIQNLGIYTLNATGEANPVASIMVTVLAEMANIERSNIVYRLNSGRESYIASGGKLGAKKVL